MDLEELLALGTKNPAMALELYPKKGAVKEESDADILIMNEDLSLDTVIAMGVPMMRDGKILKNTSGMRSAHNKSTSRENKI